MLLQQYPLQGIPREGMNASCYFKIAAIGDGKDT